MALQRANRVRRVQSRNHRRTSTACLKQPSRCRHEYRGADVRRTARRDEQHGLLAHAQRGGVCDTHRRRRTLEFDLWKERIYIGVLRLLVAPQRLRRVESPPPSTIEHHHHLRGMAQCVALIRIIISRFAARAAASSSSRSCSCSRRSTTCCVSATVWCLSASMSSEAPRQVDYVLPCRVELDHGGADRILQLVGV